MIVTLCFPFPSTGGFTSWSSHRAGQSALGSDCGGRSSWPWAWASGGRSGRRTSLCAARSLSPARDREHVIHYSTYYAFSFYLTSRVPLRCKCFVFSPRVLWARGSIIIMHNLAPTSLVSVIVSKWCLMNVWSVRKDSSPAQKTSVPLLSPASECPPEWHFSTPGKIGTSDKAV